MVHPVAPGTVPNGLSPRSWSGTARRRSAADHLRGEYSRTSVRRAILRHHAVERLPHDRVVRGVNDRGEEGPEVGIRCRHRLRIPFPTRPATASAAVPRVPDDSVTSCAAHRPAVLPDLPPFVARTAVRGRTPPIVSQSWPSMGHVPDPRRLGRPRRTRSRVHFARPWRYHPGQVSCTVGRISRVSTRRLTSIQIELRALKNLRDPHDARQVKESGSSNR